MMGTILETNVNYKRYRWVLSGWVLGLLNQSAFTQPLESHYQTRSDSAGGYWLVHTRPASRSTAVRFFSPQHQLLYQQTLAGRYLKLTKRNQRVLDSTLHCLVRGQLLTTQLRTHELREDPIARHLPRRKLTISEDAEPSTAANEQLVVNTWVMSSGQLKVMATNPAQLPVGFYLVIDLPHQSLTYRITAPAAGTPYRQALIRTVNRNSTRSAVLVKLPSDLSLPLKATAASKKSLF